MTGKLLLVTTEFPPFPGGIATYSYNMAFYAQQKGFDVSVLAPTYEYQPDFNFKFIPWMTGSFERKKFPKLVLKLYKTLMSRNFDLIHAADWPSILSLDLLNLFLKNKIHYIATIHGTDIYVFKRLLNKYPFLKFFLLRYCYKIHYNSKYTYNLAIKEMKSLLSKKKPIIQPLGLSEDFIKRKKSIDIYTKYNIPRSKKIILSVSRLDSRKGHIDAVMALNKLPESLKNELIYIIVGKKVDNSYYKELLSALKKSNFEYKYLGVVSFDELVSLYESSYLFLLPGKYVHGKVEGFGLVYLEAASKGLPSIAYKVYAVPEVVVDGKTGFLVEEGNIEDLSAKIKQLLEDEKLRSLMSENATKHAKKFTWDACVDSVYQIRGKLDENLNL